MTDETHKQYLGDGVYAETDGYHIILTVHGTAHQTGLDQRIGLEPPVMRRLALYEDHLKAEREAARVAAQNEEKG